MNIYDEPKIDCHNHIFDPARFPYNPSAHYAPTGGEIGTAANVERGACAIGITAQELAQQRGIVGLQQQFVDPSPAAWLQHKPGSRVVIGKTDCAILS